MSEHVELQIQGPATVDQQRDLDAFVRFCIERIERDHGRADAWTVKIAPRRVCYGCDVIVQRGGAVVRARGHGFDRAVAGREALSEIERMMRRCEM